MYQRNGMGFTPIVTGEPISTGLLTLTSTLVGAGGSILPFLGEPPYDDFRAKILPIVCPKARSTGIPVVVFWYGEIIMTMPDCTFRPVARVPTNNDALNWARNYGASTGPLWGYFGNGAPQFIYFGTVAPTGGTITPAPVIPIPAPGTSTVTTAGMIPTPAGFLPWILAGGVLLLMAGTRPGPRPGPRARRPARARRKKK